MIYLIILIWILSAILATGMNVAYFRQKYPYTSSFRKELGESMLMAILFGPLGLIVTFFWTGFAEYGLQYWDKK